MGSVAALVRLGREELENLADGEANSFDRARFTTDGLSPRLVLRRARGRHRLCFEAHGCAGPGSEQGKCDANGRALS
jgi:hypothetical protein